eukprot:14923022-Alexandrium_andersonii.AAC.1
MPAQLRTFAEALGAAAKPTVAPGAEQATEESAEPAAQDVPMVDAVADTPDAEAAPTKKQMVDMHAMLMAMGLSQEAAVVQRRIDALSPPVHPKRLLDQAARHAK